MSAASASMVSIGATAVTAGVSQTVA
jgi:hypothetical protein